MLGSFAGDGKANCLSVRSRRGLEMFRTKLNLVALFVVSVMAATIQSALAGNPVPAPIVGAGLPALAILGGGYWLMRKLRGPR